MKRPLLLALALLSTGCAYTRVELANKVHGTRFITSANIAQLDVKLTPTSATLRARGVDHSTPTKEIGNNFTKASAALAPLLGGAAVGL